MANKAVHTSFELSLLLSALQKYGVEHKSFDRISSEFTQNNTIAETSAYDAARIAPESLKSLYLQILKSEIQATQQYTAQQNKRKKSPTPPLQNLDEARRHKHLLPGLARRFHTEYVKEVVKQIEEDEKSYTELLTEIDIVEKQPKDDPSGKPVTGVDQAKILDNIDENSANRESVDQTSSINGLSASSETHTHSLLASTSDPIASAQIPSGLDQDVPSPRDKLSSNDSKEASNLGISIPSTSLTHNLKASSLINASNNLPSASTSRGVSSQTGASSSADTSNHSTQQVSNHQNQSSPIIPNPLAGNGTFNDLPTASDSNMNPEYLNSSLSTPNVKAPWRSQLPAAFTPLPTKLFGNLITPASLNERRRLQGLTPIDTSKSSTKWKDVPRNLAREGRSPPRPSNSPYLSDSPSPEPEFRGASKFPSIETSKTVDTPSRGRGRGARKGRGHGAKATGRSTDLANPSARIRSQSAISTVEDTVPEAIAKTLKPEPPATPSFTDEAPSFVSATGDPRLNARRRDPPRDGETPKPSLKRKRADTIDGTPDISFVSKFSRPGQILASRNFSRVVSALLNDINSHKLASVFAKPITEKSAPGYQDLIYRPQDLKSIRSAISAGSRFVATIPDPDIGSEDAAGETFMNVTPSSSTTKANNIWIDRAPEVMPPKGIVNSAQLEKELCRMLANAVMYNPDPKRGFGPHFPMTSSRQMDKEEAIEMQERHDLDDGRLVNDAREMFQSMEHAVSAWRAAERIRPGEFTGKPGGVEKMEEPTEDAADNTGAEDGEGEKSFLRRSTRG